ncbi:MAG: EAL domain-containing protein [Aestuariivirga sp.]
MFALLAVGGAVFMLATGQVHAPVIVGVVLVLAAGQAGALFFQWTRNTNLDERLSEQGDRLRSLPAEIAALGARIAWAEKQLGQLIGRPADPIIEEMRALRDSVQALARDVGNNLVRAPEPRSDPAPVPRKPAAQSPAPSHERLDFLLEPVIEFTTGATAHYRARVNMVSGPGDEVHHKELLRNADAGGVRAALDIHIAKLALPVSRRLRNKHPAMCLLVPLGAATLKRDEDLARLIAVMEDEAGDASGIIFDITHGDLAGLDTAGIEGLARLGRLGTKMALSQISIAGLDLASLRQLGVRFLDIEAASLNAGSGAAPVWSEFAQFARAMRFQMIGGGIVSPDQAEAASRIARFGYGPYFAPPRRVRADAGLAAATGRTEAA